MFVVVFGDIVKPFINIWQMYLFLTVGDEKGQGMFLLSGPSEFISNCGKAVVDIIVGKGMAKDTRMQGKAEKLQKKEQAIRICEDYIQTL